MFENVDCATLLRKSPLLTMSTYTSGICFVGVGLQLAKKGTRWS